MIEFVDTETARAARGVRMVAMSNVPSPWSEAAKGLFRLAGAPVQVVRQARGDTAQQAWTGAHNTPVVFFDDEPPRTVWSQILALAVRLGPPAALLPAELEARAATVGMIHEIAGEQGIGWNARLVMIHTSLTSGGARGFPVAVASYLGAKYGYAADRIDAARAQVIAGLAALGDQLAGHDYFAGDHPSALDVFAATFLTPLCEVSEADCPAFAAPLRAGFRAAADAFAAHVPASLFAHRQRMLERHLGWPIAI